jgi:3-oxoacyl-[acyl-carrier protein] reductase
MSRKSVLITGSSRGIGLEIAKKLSEDGFCPILHGSRKSVDLLREVSQEIENSTYKAFDLDTDPEEAVKEIVQECGGLFGLVNNAGVLASSSIFDASYEELESIFRINALSHFVVSRVFMNQSDLKEGRIVNISTNAIRYGYGRNGAVQYTASKLALEALTGGLSKLGADRKVLVNTIRPGMVNTRIQEGRDNLQERMNLIPLKRMAEPTEIADLVSYFMSDKASHITGQTISIAGGE